MEWLRLTLALLVPLLLGLQLVARLVPATPARGWLVAGYGLLAGLLLWPLLLRLWAVCGLPPGFWPPLGFAVLLLVALRWWSFAQTTTVMPGAAAPTALPAGRVARLLCILLLALLSLRLLSLALELIWRPLFPWDATMHWATKARVWFEWQGFVPFVANDEWLSLVGEGVFTDHHPDYPVTVPVWQYWLATALGRWDPALINLPWLVCYCSLGMAFYGQARATGAPQVEVIVFLFFLLTLPLLNTHVALAGYADLFLATTFGLSLMALHNGSRGGQPWQWRLALFCALGCLLVKNEGFFWMLTILPGLWVARRRDARNVLLAIAGIAVAVALVLWLFPAEIAVAGHSLGSLDLGYRPGALSGILRSLLVLGNWHMALWYLLLLTALVIWRRPVVLPVAGPLIASLSAACILFLCLFTVTEYAVGAIRQTAVGRIGLHLMPGVVFLLFVLQSQLRQLESRSATSGLRG
ncbi:MAG: hypothetical protein RJQ10_15880 [Haliea sp.]|uniref:hypothetical protein n=1 Tax=Haliea sp. TaxID=1932666 RepID=UPI0032F02CDE